MFKKFKVFYLTMKLDNIFDKIQILGYKVGSKPVSSNPDIQAEIICLASDCFILEEKLYNLYNELHDEYGKYEIRECIKQTKRIYNLCNAA